MSTRSGKRLNKSLHENILNEKEINLKSDRKTRSRRLKENCDALNVSLPKVKKQNRYVRYPTDESAEVAEPAPPVQSPPLRILRNNTLKELNIDVTTVTEKTNGDLEKPASRLTRRTRKFADYVEEDNTKTIKLNGESEAHSQATKNDGEATEVAKKSKKSNKNKRKTPSSDNEEKSNTEFERQAPQKSRKKKKGGKRSGSMVVEDIVPETAMEKQKSLNTSNTSMESFHSAAGSPQERIKRQTPRKNSKKVNESFKTSPAVKKTKEDDQTSADTTLTKEAEATSNFVLENSSKNRKSDIKPKDITFDLSGEKISDETLTKLNDTFDKDDVPRTVPQKTIEDHETTVKESNQNQVDMETKDQFNTTIDLPTKSKGDRISKVNTLDTTFDKLSDNGNNFNSKKLNSTYDTADQNLNSSLTRSKSSLISSDNAESTGNMTFDKSDENIERISLTSDDSKSSTENILNTTPVLIESSMETSRISEASSKSPAPNMPSDSAEKRSNPTLTPLKREGTFTKDGPDAIIVTSPRQRNLTDSTTSVTTPAKCKMSLPAPGSTPFHSNSKVAPRKSVLNRTHSIEKPITRQSSLGELAKPTRVMFCSPVDNPALNTLRKSKMIKSSMKGSNKSFLFEEKVTPRPSTSRKRSFTQSDAEQLGAKRKRLADDLQTSVDRLSRPRTCSATVRPTESSPAAAGPPSAQSEAKVARGKLPNFAALHQRRFQKMESLNECQERKAKRARRMLVPTGSLTVLERSSPKALEVPKSATKAPETKKPSPLSTKAEPPKPTHTRFGFKLNLDTNPFSIPSTNSEPKPVETKPNGQMKRQPTLPSLAGTTVRKDVAKQVIMREKSASTLREKRNIKRDETRTIIKGVRTNRRFELQMRLRNING